MSTCDSTSCTCQFKGFVFRFDGTYCMNKLILKWFSRLVKDYTNPKRGIQKLLIRVTIKGK